MATADELDAFVNSLRQRGITIEVAPKLTGDLATLTAEEVAYIKAQRISLMRIAIARLILEHAKRVRRALIGRSENKAARRESFAWLLDEAALVAPGWVDWITVMATIPDADICFPYRRFGEIPEPTSIPGHAWGYADDGAEPEPDRAEAIDSARGTLFVNYRHHFPCGLDDPDTGEHPTDPDDLVDTAAERLTANDDAA